MNIINRIHFPRTPEISGLYLKYNKGTSLNVSQEQPEVTFTKDSFLSLDTYFNSFYENFYAKYTNLTSLYYLLNIEGDFEISIYREDYGKEDRELIDRSKFENCNLSKPTKILIPDSWHSEKAGRIYLEIICLSSQGLFTQGWIATEQPKSQEVYLAIITCTFKKEAYIKNTVNTILKDDLLRKENFKIFVVDNGNTLIKEDFNDPKLQLIPNRNFGGSGGFTRGLIQALEEGGYTHFLFMDDDIELDSEVIYRLSSLYKYVKQDFAVAGSMLDLHKKHILYETGALYNKRFDNQGNIVNHPFIATHVNHNLDLQNTATLNLVLLEKNIDYGSFWFFGFSKEILENTGLILPFFLKIDDIEFCLRISKKFNIVPFPSLAVWHEPFYAKKPIWDTYYAMRNNLITASMHGLVSYFNVLIIFTKWIINDLLYYDYNSAQMYVRSFADYLKGPDFLKDNDPEKLHLEISLFSKNHKSQTIIKFNSSIQTLQNNQNSVLQKIVSLLTLNGNLLPKFLISNETAYILKSKGSKPFAQGLAKKRIVLITNNSPQAYQNDLDNQAGMKILLDWFKSVIKSIFIWSSVTDKWKKSAQELSSVKFWREYLQIAQEQPIVNKKN